jgi:signal transduction histidine kinase
MSAINQDLQATHKIINLIEESKRKGEIILDTIPGIFAVINNHGEVLRGNKYLSTYFNVESEQVLYRPLSDLFRKEEWEIFNSHLQRVINRDVESIDFELSMSRDNKEVRTHLWYISQFDKDKENLVTVVGKDISELRDAQKHLLEIFSSVPLGMITLEDGGVVRGQVSSYSRVIFEEEELDGKKINDVFFSKIKNLTKVQHEALDALANSVIGQKEIIFSIIKEELPVRAEMDSAKEKWVSLTYQPIVYESVIHKILIIVQDISELVRAEKSKRLHDLLEQEDVNRILQLKKINEEIKPFIFEEISEIFENLVEAAKKLDLTSMCNYLHGIKGCARVSGLTFLTEKTHSTESEILGIKESGKKVTVVEIEKIIAPAKEEWKNLFNLDRVLSGQDGQEDQKAISAQNAVNDELGEHLKKLFVEYNQLIQVEKNVHTKMLSREILLTLEAYNQHKLSEINAFVETNVAQTAESLSKSVALTFNMDNVYLTKNKLQIVNEALVHILNNAVDHGIEASDVRLHNKKSETGSIWIHAEEKHGTIILKIKDDGVGVNAKKVRDIVIKKGIIAADEAMRMDEKQIIQFIFEGDFSTSDNVTQISGRGIGLGSVKQSIEALGGHVVVSNEEVGALFEVTIPSDRYGDRDIKEVSLAAFMDQFKSIITKFNEESVRFALKFDDLLLANKAKWTIYADIDSIIYSLFHLLDKHGKKEDNTIRVSKLDGGTLLVECQVDADQDIENYVSQTCALYLRDHQGSVRFEDGLIKIEFGYLKN